MLALLVGAAFAAGVVNSIAGGGTLLTFPALLAAGLPAATANATSTVALVPGSLGAFWGFREHVRGDRRLILTMAAPSAVGGVVGALLADRVGDERFADLSPVLVFAATALFVAQEPIRRALARRTGGYRPGLVALGVLQLGVALYGGFFGAGIGILMLAALGIYGLDDIHRMNALKNLAAVCINGLAAATFAISGRVDWPIAGVMLVGGVLGGYSGARVATWVGPVAVRRAVVAIGLVIAAGLAWQRLS